MREILCFGDSNTYGLIPGTKERYKENIRWTGILQQKLKEQDCRIVEEGLCGRTTVFEDELRKNRFITCFIRQPRTDRSGCADAWDK